MGPILAAPNLRRTGLLCSGVAFGLMISPGAHNSMPTMIVASALCFAFVGLLSRYGLAS
jgi:hypothetical protein